MSFLARVNQQEVVSLVQLLSECQIVERTLIQSALALPKISTHGLLLVHDYEVFELDADRKTGDCASVLHLEVDCAFVEAQFQGFSIINQRLHSQVIDNSLQT